MSPEFVELPLRATRYIAIAGEVEHLVATASENPAEAHLYDEAIERGRLKMQILEEDAAVAFVAVAEHVEPFEITHKREMIESLRDDEDFGLVITEDDIQARLGSLPEFADYQPEVRGFVANYFAKIGELGLVNSVQSDTVTEAVAENETETPPIAVGPIPTEATKPAVVAESHEASDKPKLTIRLYKDRVIQIGDDGEFISMFRDVDIPKSSQEEAFIADARIAALRAITEIDGVERGISSRKVWDKYAPFAEYSSSWHSVIIEPLMELTFDDQPIVDIHKPRPTAKRRYHSNGAYDVEFIEMDERAPYDNREVVALPNGEYLFGLRARAVHLLLRANEDMPFTTKVAIASELYTPDEQAELTDGVNASSVISYLRRTIDEIDDFNLQTVRFDDRSMGYWLEYTGDDTGLYPFLQASEAEIEDDNPDHIAREVTSEAVDDYERSLAQVSGLANWLMANKELLATHGLPPLEDVDALAIIAQAKQANVEALETDSFEFRIAMQEMKSVLTDEAAIEDVIEKMPTDDARWKLIDYLMQITSLESGPVISSLIKEFAELDLQLDADLIGLDNLMSQWRSRTNVDRVEGLKYSYDLFHRIGESLKEQGDPDFADFNVVLHIAEKRMMQASPTTPMGFRPGPRQALTNAYSQWAANATNRGQRELRRLWASELRNALNRQYPTR